MKVSERLSTSSPPDYAEEEEKLCLQKYEEMLTGETGDKFPRDSPASSGSSPGRLSDKIEMREGKDKEVEGRGNKWGEGS